MNILLRMNDRCENVSQPRIIGTKKEVIEVCFKSLIKNINDYESGTGEHVNLQIFYNELTTETLEMVKSFVSQTNIHFVQNDEKLSESMPTFKAIYEAGCELEGPILLLEDDYYFYPGSLIKLMNFYNEQLKDEQHFCINIAEDFNPMCGDKEDDFFKKHGDIKWRKLTHTTLSFLTDSYILNKYKKRYMDIINYFHISPLPETGEFVTEVNTINRVYEEISCYAPTPSLTEHLQTWNTLSRLSPFTNIARGIKLKQIIKLIE